MNVEKEKGRKDNHIPFIGECGSVIKSFDVDAYNKDDKTVIEVEAGRAVDNNNSKRSI